jgi:uncharacterized protein (TIGR03437 family)
MIVCLWFVSPVSAGTISYSYDSLNRVNRVAYHDGTVVAYTYDSAGNRLSQVITNPAIAVPRVSADKPSLSFSAVAGQSATQAQIIVIRNDGGGSLQWNAVASVPWLRVTSGFGTNAGAVNVSASATGLTDGTYTGSVTIYAAAANAPLTIPVSLTVSGATGRPMISPGGVITAAGYVAAVARGAVGSLFGVGLADSTESASSVPLPRLLAGVQVAVNGVSAPLWFVSPGQINFQIPFETRMSGVAQVVVGKNGVSSEAVSVQVQEYAPGVFMYERTPGVLDPIVVRADGSIVSPSNPALPGDTLVVYATGLGNLTALPRTGDLSPTSPIARSVNVPTITIGEAPAEVQFSGLTPGAIGLAQFNIKLPDHLKAGTSLPLQILFGSVVSPVVQVAVKSEPIASRIETVASGLGPLARGLAVDPLGNMYFAEAETVKKVSRSGAVSVVVGTGVSGFAGDGGPATSARLNSPNGVAVDQSGNLYIADYRNGRIRMVDTNGIISTFAGTGGYADSGDGGPAKQAQFRELRDVVVGPDGNLYIVTALTVRRVGRDGIIATVAGDPSCTGLGFRGDGGPATAACLYSPITVAVDRDGSVYISDVLNWRVRRVTPDGIIRTFVGNGESGDTGDGGPPLQAAIGQPSGVLVDGFGNLLVGSCGNNRIRWVLRGAVIVPAIGTGVRGFSGDGGAPTSAQMNCPTNLALGADGAVYILDSSNLRIRKAVMPDAPTVVTSPP